MGALRRTLAALLGLGETFSTINVKQYSVSELSAIIPLQRNDKQYGSDYGRPVW